MNKNTKKALVAFVLSPLLLAATAFGAVPNAAAASNMPRVDFQNGHLAIKMGDTNQIQMSIVNGVAVVGKTVRRSKVTPENTRAMIEAVQKMCDPKGQLAVEFLPTTNHLSNAQMDQAVTSFCGIAHQSFPEIGWGAGVTNSYTSPSP